MKINLFLFFFLPLSIFGSGCKKENPPDPDSSFMLYPNGEGEIGKGGGRLILNDDASSLTGSSINIPAGALSTKSFISLEIDNSVRASLDTTADILKMEPAGLSFSKPVEVVLFPRTIQDPRIYSFSPVNDMAEEVHITFLDSWEGSVRCVVGHLMPLLITDLKNASLDAELYRTPAGLKGSILFGSISDGLITLSAIPLRSASNYFQTGIRTASELINSPATVNNAGAIHALMTITLLEGTFPVLEKLKSVSFDVRRNEIAGGSFSVTVTQMEPAESKIFNSRPLDFQVLEDFFCGKALIFNMGLNPLPGYDYYLSLSWILSDSSAENPHLTSVYHLSTFNNHLPWVYQNMLTEDKDTNNNFIDDTYDQYEAAPH